MGGLIIQALIMFDFFHMMYAPMERHDLKLFMARILLTTASFYICSPFTEHIIIYQRASDFELILLATMISLIYILAAISIIFGLFLIKNLGLGADTKRMIMWRHASLVIAYTVCNIYVLYCVAVRKSNDASEQDVVSVWYVKVLQALFYA